MRHGTTNNRRQRNRGGNGNRGGQPRMQVFDSNGPDVRIRGTAYQVTEKYLTLAKDAAASGDTILAQSYLQHAEHYQRVINSWEENGGVRPDTNPSLARQGEPSKAQEKSSQPDDLALPESILGAPVGIVGQSTQDTKELAD